MSKLFRVASPVVAFNVVGIVVSTLAAIAGLRFATPDTAAQPTAMTTTAAAPTTTDPTSKALDSNTFSAHSAAVRIEGGELRIAPDDWESVNKIRRTQAHVATFWLDRHEVTYADWARCSTCKPEQSISGNLLRPVVNVTPEQAFTFCTHQRGRLPTRYEWVFAASTPNSNRYPWGQTGLVCRKVVFGMVKGPCAFSQSAQAVGSRPEGATATDVQDLSGNVAEWATEDGSYLALGGSFRSTLAGQLKVWAAEDTQLSRDDIGFRCAYDAHDAHE